MCSHETSPHQLGTTPRSFQHLNYQEQVTYQQHNEHLSSYPSSVTLRDQFHHLNSGRHHSQASTHSSPWPSTSNFRQPSNEPMHAITATSQQTPKISTSRTPNSQTRKKYGLFFSSFTEAYSAIPLPKWPLNPSDITIPMTDEVRRQWIWKLVRALNNIENVHDKPSSSFRKNWFDPVKGPSTIYSAEDKEILCWQILGLAEDLHRDGPSVLKSFDSAFWDHAVKTREWTFQERMEKIIEVIKYSKARCTKMLKGAGQIKALVANPENLSHITLGNAKQNGMRQELLIAGRATNQQVAKVETTADEAGAEPMLWIHSDYDA